MNAETVVWGLDVGGTQVRAALASDGRIVTSRASVWPPNLSSVQEAHFVADQALDILREASGVGPVRAAGIALAALVDREGTVVHWPNRPEWRGLPLRPLLEERLGVPVLIEDDANAAALAEWTLGAGRGYRHLLIMTIGTGVGAGLILDSKLFRGQQGWAGELGHLVVQADGPVCACGHRGCLQMMASGRALARVATEHELAGAEAVTAAAEQGEAWALEALERCGHWLGLAAANVVNLLDLEAVIVGGGLSTLGAPWWSALENTLRANLLNPNHRDVALHRAALPDTAGLLGAVAIALQTEQP